MRRWLESIILNASQYNELSLVLADSYTKIFQSTLQRKSKLFWIASACFIVSLGLGVAAILLYQDTGEIENMIIGLWNFSYCGRCFNGFWHQDSYAAYSSCLKALLAI